MVAPLLLIGGGVAAYALLKKRPVQKTVEEATPEEIQQAAPEKLDECVKLDVVAQTPEAAFAPYKAKGWTVAPVDIEGKTTLYYACPPGVLPPEWGAMIEELRDKGECVFPSDVPGQVMSRLRDLGWDVMSTMPPCPPPAACVQVMRQMLCPPGHETSAPKTSVEELVQKFEALIRESGPEVDKEATRPGPKCLFMGHGGGRMFQASMAGDTQLYLRKGWQLKEVPTGRIMLPGTKSEYEETHIWVCPP